MLKYLSKFAMDILPSVAATIIGAYIVNHYINTKPAADAPGAAAVSSVDPKKAGAKPSVASSNIPESGVRAKGIPEKAVFDKSVAEKVQEKPQEKAAEKTADRPTETASIPAETRRHQPAPRDKATAEKTTPEKMTPEKTTSEKAIAKVVPAPAQPAGPAAAPVIAAPVAAPAVDVAVTPEEHRDANDLARAAIERLRGGSEGGASRLQEATRDPAHGPDAPRVISMPVATAPSVRPLPPPIMISTPAAEAAGSSAQPGYPTSPRDDDPRRPTPPADIPEAAPPLDLRAEAVEPAPAPKREHTNVAEDVLSAAKSVFHAVLPK
jgi:hypothetical protein